MTQQDRTSSTFGSPTAGNEPNELSAGKKRLKKWAIRAGKLVVIALVLGSFGRQLSRSWNRLPEFQPDLPLLALSGLLYVIGLVVFGFYYARVVRLVAPKVNPVESIRAYILSHPAKYVPGKAMVVVIRVGLISRSGARATAAMLSALYETLSMMAIGGLLGAILLAMPPAHPMAAWLSAGVGAAFLATVLPMTFSRAARLLKKGLATIEPEDSPSPGRSDWPALVLFGVTGWLCWGLSQVAVVVSLDTEGAFRPSELPRVAGGVMLATVGGFALPILPGGLGLREWILNEVTGGVLGADLAIASAIVLRFVWIIAELVAAAAVGLIPSRATSNTPAKEPEAV
ncbi:MAG: hypothetical protein ACKO85_13090 [Isosphaeraceae bacterium]